MPGKCRFQRSWLNNDNYREWLAPDVSNPHKARCKICCKCFDITAMGESAVKSHQKSAKHSENMQAAGSSGTMKSFLTISESRPNEPHPVPSQSSDLMDACKKHELVMDAEILWTLKVITSHYSYRSSAHVNELFKKMFPDSEVAQAFTCGEQKCSYIACHGLRPFFLSSLRQEIGNSDYYVVLFDESLNEHCQQKQMDVHLRYWDASQSVTTRYFTSVFMGHARAEDLQEKLLNALEPLPLQKIVQISMDGPNVNLKALKGLQEHLHKNYQVRCLDLGSCSLHTVHNAYKAGLTASKWRLDVLLSSVSRLFLDAPARREDFVAVTGQSLFPLKFCAHRWIENVPVIERVLLLWSDVKEYVEVARSKEVNLPKCASFQNLVDFCCDPLVIAKLKFALAVAVALQPFLTLFQTDRPLVFFLAKDLENIVRKLLTKFLKPSILCSSVGITGLLKIDIEDLNNHVPLEKVDVGQTAEQLLKSHKISAKAAFAFRMQCKQFLLSVTKKILEKSPLRYTLVRGLSSLDPRQMLSKPDECIEGLKKVLDALIVAERMNEHSKDTVLAQFIELLQERKHDLQLFERSSHALDKFFYELLKIGSAYNELWSVVKLLLTLSHGQASVERGFSVNRQVSTENMNELSHISQRIICDAVNVAGGICNVPITKELRTSVASARNQYRAFLETRKRQEQEDEKQKKKRCIEEEVEVLTKKKKKLEAAVKELTASADSYAEKAEATSDLTCIIKSNSLRKTAKTKQQEILDIDVKIQEKQHDVA